MMARALSRLAPLLACLGLLAIWQAASLMLEYRQLSDRDRSAPRGAVDPRRQGIR